MRIPFYLERLMPAKAVIFDMDGTLLDSLDDLADAGNAMLAELGYPVHPVASYKNFVGDGMEVLVRRALPDASKSDLPRALESMRREYGARWKDKSSLYPGVAEMLDALVARNIPMVVFSNKPQDFALTIMKAIFGRWPFAMSLGAGGASGDIPKKPDPAGALLIARELGIAPADFLLVGDSPMDVQCALRAGMTPVAVTWGFREEADLRAAGADVVISQARELLTLV